MDTTSIDKAKGDLPVVTQIAEQNKARAFDVLNRGEKTERTTGLAIFGIMRCCDTHSIAAAVFGMLEREWVKAKTVKGDDAKVLYKPVLPGSWKAPKSRILKSYEDAPILAAALRSHYGYMGAADPINAVNGAYVFPEGFLEPASDRYTNTAKGADRDDMTLWNKDVARAREAITANKKRVDGEAKVRAASGSGATAQGMTGGAVPDVHGEATTSAINALNVELRTLYGADIDDEKKASLIREIALFARDTLADYRSTLKSLSDAVPESAPAGAAQKVA